MLDDYAFTVSAFIDLYQATFDEKWLYKAKELTEYAMGHFTDNSSGMFWYTSNDHSDLIARKMEIADNVIPSSNSEMALNLYLLGIFFDNEPYMVRARQMLENVNDDMMGNISSYANWGRLGIHFVRPLFEVAITGQDCDSIRKTMDRSYLPDAIFLGGRNEGTLSLLRNKLVPGQTTIYVCVDKTCRMPVSTAEEALQQMR